ncbi:hypothetical protein XENTR_v10022698 [Xenopus tropicalis]|nr:hypothetical protein XENTR_v10022698 [Xenopus tropicalis]|eukprot:XP_017945224.1 PREDICTED: high affinity immunoglobulin gamma Fc receptor I-like [Xenopus tropicalis]
MGLSASALPAGTMLDTSGSSAEEAAGMEITGATVRPVVSLAPNWSMIFRRESLTVSCDLASAPQGNQSYYWYRDNQLLPTNQQNFTIQSASMFDRGNYQCRTSTSKRSAAVRLDVTDDYAILQTPPSVHEGDFLSLRCHSWAGYYEEYTVFYKGEEMIQNSTSDLLSMGAVAINASGLYKCTKKSHFFYRPAQYKATISVLELFSAPQIKLSPNPVTEGDHMTITCDTELSPHRETTELQFAFYRNGHNVQGFNSSNQYGVPSAQLEDSGNYTCEVQTPTGSVRKRSGMAHIHIQDTRLKGQLLEKILPLVFLNCLLTGSVGLIYLLIRALAPQLNEKEHLEYLI